MLRCCAAWRTPRQSCPKAGAQDHLQEKAHAALGAIQVRKPRILRGQVALLASCTTRSLSKKKKPRSLSPGRCCISHNT
eukprot:m.232688 g.232688  ORF g.232688 m.232688 type:complete len:79 (+) comp54280_c0_seq107:45-281(+)